eukprot:c11173_g1_i1.p1 GENE.c11173_g1_i1~~c11173_g1_i1.p1  ORF type:complete len:255 (+),score=64.58 c11173_g1_i1:178-942(+)
MSDSKRASVMEDSIEARMHNHNNLVAVISQRREEFEYLKRLHSGGVYWMNVIGITKDDLLRGLYDKDKPKTGKAANCMARVEDWFFLGVTLAPLLELSDSSQFVRGLAQCIEEFEYAIANPASQSLKYLLRESSVQMMVDPTEPVRPKVRFNGSQPAFLYMAMFNLPCSLDPFEVMFSLCDVLSEMYAKFEADDCALSVLYEAILKLDARIKKHVLSFLVRDLEALAASIVQTQLASLDTLFAFGDQFRIEESK